MRARISVNKLAHQLVKKLEKNSEYYGVTIEKLPSGATVRARK